MKKISKTIFNNLFVFIIYNVNDNLVPFPSDIPIAVRRLLFSYFKYLEYSPFYITYLELVFMICQVISILLHSLSNLLIGHLTIFGFKSIEKKNAILLSQFNGNKMYSHSFE